MHCNKPYILFQILSSQDAYIILFFLHEIIRFQRVPFFISILACSNRTYGENCSQTCGKCRNLGQCHHINGTCSNGCDRGYQGDKCDKSEYLGIVFLVFQSISCKSCLNYLF